MQTRAELVEWDNCLQAFGVWDQVDEDLQVAFSEVEERITEEEKEVEAEDEDELEEEESDHSDEVEKIQALFAYLQA